ncbi:unnamed protein product [Cylindrotheca closterium]|uniref:Disease resistance R13L4/SHOC-2-like LRR domain-containing protein n=1 Tax=Cylindrotheca closterium TaxID=2856 RepID=A0AAD2FW81_9STRA|nr:unnamed protein product [Cylindrotheca closterium]
MDPAGKAFIYDNVEQDDAPDNPPDADGDVFEDEIVFNIEDEEADNGNEGLMFEEGAEAGSPTSPPVSGSNRKVICSCLVLAIAVLTTLAIILTVDVEEVAERNSAMEGDYSKKDQLIDVLMMRGIAVEKVLRSFSDAQGQAVGFLAEEDWDGEMSWLYGDFEGNLPLIIERYVLAVIYFECEGIDWFHAYEFLTAQDHCDWNTVFEIDGEATIEGVTSCNGDGLVERLYFPINNLRCQDGLPDEIRYLSNLEALVARGNTIEGEFPFFVRELTNLSVLSFGYNEMEGTLPVWLGEMTLLSVLHLSDNTFVGEMPPSLNQLTNLKYLGMDDNFFTGNLNDYLPSLVNLEWLYMEDNQFTGPLDWLNSLDSLSYLDVSKNKLTGDLPSNLFDHPNLSIMDLHGNEFTGKLPTVTKQNGELQLFSVHSNDLTGTIPIELQSIVNITMLDLSFNSFTGTIPALSETTRLRFLMTSGNSFNQQEMPFIAGLTSLVELSMKGNNIVGNIPQWVGDLTNMKWLDLDANELIGTIPSEIAKLSGLYALLLNRNDLDGTLPTEISQLQGLEVFLIDGNDITGETSAICNKADKIDFFISDCGSAEGQQPQLDCPCCTVCCITGDTECSDLAWTSMHDPVVENEFSRGYSFNYSDASAQFTKLNDVNP